MAASPRPTRREWIIGALLISVPLALRTPRPAWSHAVLVRATPGPRSRLRRAPDRIQLWFNERLEPAFSSVTVVDDTGARVDRGDVRIEPDDRTRIAVSLSPLSAGTYRVRYRVLSVDGHVVQDEYPFTIQESLPR